MKKRWLIFSIFLLGIVGIIFFVFGSREPSYKGHRLSYWLEPPRSGAGVKGNESVIALRKIGSNAVPFLIHDLKAKDSAFGLFYRTNWPRLPVWLQKKLPTPQTPEARRGRAVWALETLGPAAEAAVPQLIQLVQDTGPPRPAISSTGPTFGPGQFRFTSQLGNVLFRSGLFRALATIGGTNKDLVPTLIEGARESQRWFSLPVAAWFQTDRLTVASEQSIELLKAGLSDSSLEVQEFCIRALGLAVPERPDVIPFLLERLGDRDPGLGEIAMQTLARAGQKSDAVSSETIRSIKVDGTNYLKIRLLADIGPRAAAALPILADLVNTNGLVKYHAARGLWTIGKAPDAILPFWIEDLQRGGDTTRWQTLILIGNTGAKGKLALAAVMKALGEDESNRIRAKAAMTLGEIGLDAPEALLKIKGSVDQAVPGANEFFPLRPAARQAP